MLDLIRDYGICVFEICIFYDFFVGFWKNGLKRDTRQQEF